jgi:hypothetical protein
MSVMTAPLSAAERSQPYSKALWWLTAVLALAAVGAGVLLTGVSAWFLAAVALAGAGPASLVFNFHTPAAFVRLFAMMRIGAKYSERLVGHRAALLDQIRRRARLFAAMARNPATRAASWQLGNQEHLSDYIEDVEDVDYARLRLTIPASVSIAAFTLLTAATTWLAPLSLLMIIPLAIILVIASAWSLKRVASSWARVRQLRRRAGRLLGSSFALWCRLRRSAPFRACWLKHLLDSAPPKARAWVLASRSGSSTRSPVLSDRWQRSRFLLRRGMQEIAAALCLCQVWWLSPGWPSAKLQRVSLVSSWLQHAIAQHARASMRGWRRAWNNRRSLRLSPA